MSSIFEPLILAAGSHKAGSGKGCAMNVISWENGDVEITDFPACSDPMLARLVQQVNDRLAGSNSLLSAEDSLVALELGHATVGTSGHGLSDLDLRRVYVRVACMIARKVVHLDASGTALPAIEAAEVWAKNPTEENFNTVKRVRDATYAYAYATYAHAHAAADAATHAATHAAHAATHAAHAAAYAYAYADADARKEFLIESTREAIAMFKDLTGVEDSPVEPERAVEAYRKMVAV